MIEKNLTKHMTQDRIDRATFIMTNCEIGTVVRERISVDKLGRPYKKQLTNTGIMFVRNADSNVLVTVYIATIQQAKEMYHSAHLPDSLYKYLKEYNKFHVAQDTTEY